MTSKINLPIIDALTVKNYDLYPGEKNRGITIEFKNGVTVLAGTNGIGKTTLLNLLLRMLVGPLNPAKQNQDIGRVSKRLLVSPSKFEYFKVRVSNPKKNATATISFRIGESALVVTRQINSMKLEKVVINRKQIEFQTEVAFIEHLARLSGLSSSYDFHIAVRFLQFFSEERLPILWSPGTQFEFFNILVFDTDLSSNIHSTFAEIQKYDTDQRNRHHQLQKRKENMPEPEPTELELAALDSTIEVMKLEFSEIDKKYNAKVKEHSETQSDIELLQKKIEEYEAKQHELEERFSVADAQYIAQSLPTMDSRLRFLMHGFGSGKGCFVCGTRVRKKAAEISKELRKGNCFVCHEPIKTARSGNIVPLSAKKIKQLEDNILSLQCSIEQYKVSLDERTSSAALSLSEISELASARLTLQRKIDILKAKRPKSDNESYSEAFGFIKSEELAIENLDRLKKEAVERYRLLVDKAQKEMDTMQEEIASGLKKYAESFLQEEICIKFTRNTPFKLATGAGKVNIPTFSIAMTSNTHPVPHDRKDGESVSESQKEFLDLAFRMALLDIICSDKASMLVIETPEASLDSWFMIKAAELMRKFAEKGSKSSRKLFATSNINGTRMIPALLGLIDETGEIRPLKESEKGHLVDLMKVTAGTAALKESDAKKFLEDELMRIAHVEA